MKTEAIRELDLFVQKAEKLGKYRASTAAGLRAALRALESGLTGDDPDTTDYVQEHLEELMHRQVEKAELAPNTVQTYIQRVTRIVSDWRRYGRSPKELLAWAPRRVERKRRPVGKEVEVPRVTAETRRLAWSLRPDLVIEIELPKDFNNADRDRLRKLIDLELEVFQKPSA